VVRFRYSLRVFQLYRVRTRLLYWDHRWFFLEHAFIDASDRCVAVGTTRAAMRRRREWVPAVEVVTAVRPGAERPAPPAYLRDWLTLEKRIFDTAATHAAEARDVAPGLAGAE